MNRAVSDILKVHAFGYKEYFGNLVRNYQNIL